MDAEIKACIDRTINRTPLVYSKEGRTRLKKVENDNVLSFISPSAAVLWAKGAAVRVRFLEGDPGLQKKVQDYASEWTKYGDIKLQFVSDGDAEIRIAFTQGAGSWSTIGTDAMSVTRQAEPTMNYGWLTPGSDDQAIAEVVLHEFGHAVGLAHEHQNPVGGIKWNKEAVYRDLSGPPNNWSREKIDHNMFDRYNEDIAIYSTFDPKSIMLYPIPAPWTMDGGAVGWGNKELSENDKTFIQRCYG
jgi:serralysin